MKGILMNTRNFLLFISAVISVAIITFIAIQEVHEVPAERIIQSYMKANDIHFRSGTDEYGRFMKGILLGEYPDLTGKNSRYIHNSEELGGVLKYAGTHMNKSIFDIFKHKYVEPYVKEAEPPE